MKYNPLAIKHSRTPLQTQSFNGKSIIYHLEMFHRDENSTADPLHFPSPPAPQRERKKMTKATR